MVTARGSARTRRGLGAGALVLLLTLAAACSDDGEDSDASDGSEGADTAADEEAVGDEGAAAGAPVPSAGCEAPATEERDLEEGTLEVRGAERRYLLSAPAWEDGDDPLPLVVDIHGLAEGAEVHAGMSQLGPQGVEDGFATLFPHGTGEPVRWAVGVDPEENDDLAYMADLLDLAIDHPERLSGLVLAPAEAAEARRFLPRFLATQLGTDLKALGFMDRVIHAEA
jgi:hypothetical protein